MLMSPATPSAISHSILARMNCAPRGSGSMLASSRGSWATAGPQDAAGRQCIPDAPRARSAGAARAGRRAHRPPGLIARERLVALVGPVDLLAEEAERLEHRQVAIAEQQRFLARVDHVLG